MMKLHLFFLFLLCFGLTCEAKNKALNGNQEKVVIANQISKECAQRLSRRYDMVQSGGGGRMMYEVEGLFLAFDIYRSLSKEEARAILMDCAHEVITTVNQNTEIQKYLLPGGFNQKSVQIQIYISPDHKDNFYPDIGVCAYNFGKLSFSTYDPGNPYVYKTSERETYEEALTLLENSHPLKEFEKSKEVAHDNQK